MHEPIPGLRSPYEKIGGIHAIGRMFDKARLFAQGKLPADYHPFLGTQKSPTLDGRCCRLLRIDYAALTAEIRAGRNDDELLDWIRAHGQFPTETEIEIWNACAAKRGWRDETSGYLQKILVKNGFAPDAASTFFDNMDLDEGRPLRFPPDPALYKGIVKASVDIHGLRSPYEHVGGIVHFGRMLDKIRLDKAGLLPPDWTAAMNAPNGFDHWCCRFLRIDYAALKVETVKGASDETLLSWAFAHGGQPDNEQILAWNAWATKRCWRDENHHRLVSRLQEVDMPANAALTMFDFIDLDEGRLPRY